MNIHLLRSNYVPHADQANADAQSAYMQHKFIFFGIKKPQRDLIEKELIKFYPIKSEQELITIVQMLWDQPERELQYTALTFLQKYKKYYTPALLHHLKQWITVKSWWDTVDALAVHTAGALITHYPELNYIMDEWICDANMWLRRTALLHQLKYKQATNQERLFDYCKKTIHEKEFFIRKAIGWVLREYSKTNPQAVKEFIQTHEHTLSGLSKREGSKYLS
jgi:3-methyladenine DNA glycosylase AlkD